MLIFDSTRRYPLRLARKKIFTSAFRDNFDDNPEGHGIVSMTDYGITYFQLAVAVNIRVEGISLVVSRTLLEVEGDISLGIGDDFWEGTVKNYIYFLHDRLRCKL